MTNEAGKFCEWTSEAAALRNFASYYGKTQSAKHIKPLHWYVACRLVIEGGFNPDDITPRPPFRVREKTGIARTLEFDPSLAGKGEQAILGGLKTKNVDVVVSKRGLGPVLAISCKGVTRALRNLTNRMEETIGECTNLHITYPALVLGYFVVVRANRRTTIELEEAIEEVAAEDADEADDADMSPTELAENDIVIGDDDAPVPSIVRFSNALSEMTGRQGIRSELSRYEAIGLSLVETDPDNLGSLFEAFPVSHSPLHASGFFEQLYLKYDERFVVSAPELAKETRRLQWKTKSPGLKLPGLDYAARLAETEPSKTS